MAKETAKEQKQAAVTENATISGAEILAATLAANAMVAASGSGTNSYELRNEHLLEEQKRRIRYKNGYTLPASVEALHNDALRKVRHDRILKRNMLRANPNTAKHPEADTHHIVARLAKEAVLARGYLFNWGIGINDADNGAFLPPNNCKTVSLIRLYPGAMLSNLVSIKA